MALTQDPDTIAARLEPGEAVEQWFDRELRPVMLHLLDQVRRQAEADRELTFRSLKHWLDNLPQRYGSYSDETRQVVAALADELRGRAGLA